MSQIQRKIPLSHYLNIDIICECEYGLVDRRGLTVQSSDQGTPGTLSALGDTDLATPRGNTPEYFGKGGGLNQVIPDQKPNTKFEIQK